MPQDTRLVWEQSLTEDLFLPEPGIRETAARSLASLTGVDGPVQCVVFTLPTGAEETERDAYRALRRAAATQSHVRCLALVAEGIGTLVVPVAGTGVRAIETLSRSGRKELQTLGRDHAALSAAGDVVPDLGQAHASRQQALAALRVVRRTGEFGAHAQWADLGAYRLLVHIDTLAAVEELLPDELVEIMSSPAAVDILETVEVYLDYAGDVQASVRALNVHRTSLYYRLKRFTEVSGLDLRDGQVRLTVHAAIKLARLSGWRPGQAVAGLGADRT
ncbi:PucR family transcriptional regulator [Ornithinimicrobium cavernae]|uniref:PucR family transcriptional regulator n=1 Tax=Ornithinimicrobium cavernae TaxID=2666047 RepID=UPI0012B16217|nr:PucR family transcriptional regulator [Ornithinimicrobium cavernae]